MKLLLLPLLDMFRVIVHSESSSNNNKTPRGSQSMVNWKCSQFNSEIYSETVVDHHQKETINLCFFFSVFFVVRNMLIDQTI